MWNYFCIFKTYLLVKSINLPVLTYHSLVVCQSNCRIPLSSYILFFIFLFCFEGGRLSKQTCFFLFFWCFEYKKKIDNSVDISLNSSHSYFYTLCLQKTVCNEVKKIIFWSGNRQNTATTVKDNCCEAENIIKCYLLIKTCPDLS